MRPLFSNWHREREIDRPPVGEPLKHCVELKSSLPAPLHKRFGFSTELDKSITPHIRGLLPFCCPSAIARLIVSVVVDSINRMALRWLRPHIFKKSFERITPPLAHRYSAPSVAVVALGVLVFAPLNDSVPRLVNWSASHSVRGSFEVAKIGSLAPAAFGFSSSEARAPEPPFGPADASAQILFVRSDNLPFALNNSQESKLLAFDNCEVFHGPYRIKRTSPGLLKS